MAGGAASVRLRSQQVALGDWHRARARRPPAEYAARILARRACVSKPELQTSARRATRAQGLALACGNPPKAYDVDTGFPAGRFSRQSLLFGARREYEFARRTRRRPSPWTQHAQMSLRGVVALSRFLQIQIVLAALLAFEDSGFCDEGSS
ncbi:uncharacterized protein SRS1_00797 [Sporisorium reilianum f. sp. reilianum]|uniref:Uncharacterized protein n=1 Tax=Sporisorium reilianum f. sp. reilianum TaxID=72559 RepID=A0A2N8UFW5_9BASI|nr:uncharacterized protein SRS1_00797 [Sporisorium reilianum f. sp. reilianum]